MGWELLQQLLYRPSPELAPSDFSFVWTTEQITWRHKFKNAEDVQQHASINFDMVPTKT